MKHVDLIDNIRAKIDEPTALTWTCFDLLESGLEQELCATKAELDTLRRARTKLYDFVAAKERGSDPDPTPLVSLLTALEASFKKRNACP